MGEGLSHPRRMHSYPVPAPQQDFLEHPCGHLQGGERQEGTQSGGQRRGQQQLSQAPQEQSYLLGISGKSRGPAVGLPRSCLAPFLSCPAVAAAGKHSRCCRRPPAQALSVAGAVRQCGRWDAHEHTQPPQHGGFPASCKACMAEMAFFQAATREEKPGWVAVGKEP